MCSFFNYTDNVRKHVKYIPKTGWNLLSSHVCNMMELISAQNRTYTVFFRMYVQDITVVIYSVSALGGEEQYSRNKQKVVKVIRNDLYECRTRRTNCKFRDYIRKNQTRK